MKNSPSDLIKKMKFCAHITSKLVKSNVHCAAEQMSGFFVSEMGGIFQHKENAEGPLNIRKSSEINFSVIQDISKNIQDIEDFFSLAFLRDSNYNHSTQFIC